MAALHYNSGFAGYAAIALGWYLAFFLIFFAYPFFSDEEGKALSWAISALAGPLQFALNLRHDRERVSSVGHALRLPPLLFCPMPSAPGFSSGNVRPIRRPAMPAWPGKAAPLYFSLPSFSRSNSIANGSRSAGRSKVSLWSGFSGSSRIAASAMSAAVLLCLAFIRLALNPAVFEYHQRTRTPIWNWYLYAYGSRSRAFSSRPGCFRAAADIRFEQTFADIALLVRRDPGLPSPQHRDRRLLLDRPDADLFVFRQFRPRHDLLDRLGALRLCPSVIGMKKHTRWVRYSGVALLW